MACNTYLDNLRARRDQVCQRLADLDRDAAAGSKPNVKMADGGTTVDHVGFRKSLYEELEQLDKLIEKAEQSGDGAGGIDGLEVVTYADP